jgi:glycosyltransferase involved in cell wall biosynthesis
MTPILWVTHVYPRHPEDIFGSFLHRLARELPKRGFTLHVVAPAWSGLPPRETRDGVIIHRFGTAEDSKAVAYTGRMHREAARHPIAFARFLKAMRLAIQDAVATVAPAIVHSHWWFPGGWIASRALGRHSKLPCALSIHGTDLRLLLRLPAARLMARGVFARMDSVMPVSSYLAAATAPFGVSGKVMVLPMPVDSEVFTPGPEARRADFVFAGRLVRQKRADLAIRGVAYARTQEVDAHLHVVGDGPEHTPLQHIARELGCDSHVTFHGMQPPRRLAELFRSACAAVLPSEEEGYGLVLVEAALCETPGIGVRSGAIPELVVPGETGWLVSPGDGTGIGAAMVQAGSDPKLREDLGRGARSRALSRTAPHVADRLAEIYRDMLGSSVQG